MRNALNKLADGVTDPAEKKVSIPLPHPAGLLRQSPNMAEMRNGSLAVCHEHAAWLTGGFTSLERMLTHAVL
jgi:hypothetical protein